MTVLTAGRYAFHKVGQIEVSMGGKALEPDGKFWASSKTCPKQAREWAESAEPDDLF